MSTLQGIIFDMDGVIVDSNPYHKKALLQFCKKYGFDLSEEEFKSKIYGRTNRDWIISLFGEINEECYKKYALEKESLFRELYKDEVKPVAGIEKFLQLLQKNNIPFAIGTSAPFENVEFTLKKTGLKDYFPIILDDTQVSKGKPHPEIYLKCARALGLSPQDCLVFEDSISGVTSAKAAGTKVVGITTTHSSSELSNCDQIISDFNNLQLDKLKILF